jgi:DNA-binding PadR family transcriptional regulator
MSRPRDKNSQKRPRPINATVGSLLGFLHQGPQSGWDLVNTAQQTIGDFWSLTRSQIYRELVTMTERGFIEADAVGRRDRRPYRLTDTGRQAFNDWLTQEPGPEQIRYPLLLTLAFAGHLKPAQIAAFLDHHRAAHTTQLHAYRQQRAAAEASGARPRDLITLDFGQRYEAAVLDWFDHLPHDLTNPAASQPTPPSSDTVAS